MPFTHLHVASGFSQRYGASLPPRLVAAAAERGMGALALTDRDTVAGAGRFLAACAEHGVAPLLGVDLAVEPSVPVRERRSRTPRQRGAGLTWWSRRCG
jgi:error-prone DNA polymerase